MPKPSKYTPPPLPGEISPVGIQITVLRKKLGLSQEGLADKIGISRKQVSDYELGSANLTHTMVIRFALALGVSSDELLGLKDLDTSQDSLSLRFTRRIRELDQLPEAKKKVILQLLDDLIRANS